MNDLFNPGFGGSQVRKIVASDVLLLEENEFPLLPNLGEYALFKGMSLNYTPSDVDARKRDQMTVTRILWFQDVIFNYLYEEWPEAIETFAERCAYLRNPPEKITKKPNSLKEYRVNYI